MSEGKKGTTPHDHLVRDTLAIPESVLPVLHAALPAALLAQLDLATLRSEPGTFVDRSGETRTDLLFSARLGERRVLLYLLLEHQSRPDPAMPRRMLTYMTRIWREHARTHRGAPLPVIVPIVLHHGEGGWTAPRRLGEMLDWDEATRAVLAPHVPDFELLVDDLARVPEAELLARGGAALGRLVVWVLRATRVGFDPALNPALIERWAAELNEAQLGGPEEAFLHLMQYLLSTEEGAAPFEALEKAPLSERVREIVMGSYQHRWMQEGEARGRAEGEARGEARGRAELLLKQLRLRFHEVPEALERRVREASIEELDRWGERVLSADALERVFD